MHGHQQSRINLKLFPYFSLTLINTFFCTTRTFGRWLKIFRDERLQKWNANSKINLPTISNRCSRYKVNGFAVHFQNSLLTRSSCSSKTLIYDHWSVFVCLKNLCLLHLKIHSSSQFRQDPSCLLTSFQESPWVLHICVLHFTATWAVGTNGKVWKYCDGCFRTKSTGRSPSVSGAVVDWNPSIDLLFFIEKIYMNNMVAIICSKMQILTQMFQ